VVRLEQCSSWFSGKIINPSHPFPESRFFRPNRILLSGAVKPRTSKGIDYRLCFPSSCLVRKVELQRRLVGLRSWILQFSTTQLRRAKAEYMLKQRWPRVASQRLGQPSSIGDQLTRVREPSANDRKTADVYREPYDSAQHPHLFDLATECARHTRLQTAGSTAR
jgi:hypothetical protein